VAEKLEPDEGTDGRAQGDLGRPSTALWQGRVLAVAAVLVVLASLALRFAAKSDMWLDEALTLDIARLPLSHLQAALKRDGAPPLYYVLLHFWVGGLGTSDVAVRALSGLLSCATLPFVWIGARRIGGRDLAVPALLLMAVSPFAIRYATENRMYALVVFLGAAGVVALQRALSRPTVANTSATAVVVAALLYSHYWSLYLAGVVLLWLLFQAFRGPAQRRRGARWSAAAVVVGFVAFVPWLPTFVYQSKHTGTPITSFAGGATSQGRALALLYFALAGLGLFGAARGAMHIDLDLRTRPAGRGFAVVLVGTLAAAIAGGYLSASAFQARYASVVLVPLVLLVALGMLTFADLRVRAGVLAATVVFGLATAIPNIWTSRTQAGEVASALAASARPGDVVAFCPDQIGPAVYHLVPKGRYQMITFPRGTSPEFVDWVDYASATRAGNPATFAARLEAMSEPDHQIWLVWAPGYQTYGTKCEDLETALLSDKQLGAAEVFPYKQVNDSWIVYEEMELVHFSHVGR
jgi:mannosyltransferase